MITIAVLALWTTTPAMSADETDGERIVRARAEANDTPSDAIFLQALEEDVPPLVAPLGPWARHPSDTPLISGPWAVDRIGTANVDIRRDGSARGPELPRVSWGILDDDEPTAGPSTSPWEDSTHNLPGVSARGTGPLTGRFPIKILGQEPDAMLIELPVLVIKTPAEFQGSGFWLIAEIFVDGRKVGDHRQIVDRTTISTMGPTHAYIKAQVPTPAPQGQIDIRVTRIAVDGDSAEPLFIRTLRFGK